MTTCIRLITNRFPLCLVVLALLAGVATRAHAETYRIDIEAHPSRIIYGTDNKTNIQVIVRDSLDKMVPDGTAVYFYTTLGDIPNVAYTQGGRVSVLMDNQTGPGIATITVTVGSSRQNYKVEYLGPGGVTVAAPQQRVSYRLKANRVYYSVDQRIFDLRDHAEFTAPNFTINATAIQYDVRLNRLRAQNDVTITVGKKIATARYLTLEMNGSRGVIVTSEPNICFMSFTLGSLECKEDAAARAAEIHALDPLPTHTWIICKDATIFPGQQIQFRRPEFYLNNFDRRLYSLPNHVIDLTQSNVGTFFNSKISLTSDAGVNVDFPIYFIANPSNIASLHIREVTQGGQNYRGTSGLQFGIEEEYLIGNKGDGALYLDDLSRPTRSAAWEHAHDFGKTRVNLNASYDRYAEDTPYSSRFGLSASRSIGRSHLSWTSNWSSFAGNQDGLAELSLSLPELPLGKTGFGLGFKPYLGYTRSFTPRQSDSETDIQSDNFYQGLVNSLGFPLLHILGGTVTTNLSDEIAHDSDGTLTNYLEAGTNYRRQMAKYFSMSLGYYYSIAHSNTDLIDSTASQRLSFDLSGYKSQAWSMYNYASYDIRGKSLYGSSAFTYYLPWNRAENNDPRWYFRYNGSLSLNTYDRIGADNTVTSTRTINSDHLLSLGRDFKNFSIVLHYSPSGNNAVTGFGSGTGKKWAIELVRQGW
ncbi:MAG: hypothetical protein ACYDBB_11660 [Armatimonadota bacterium]